MTAYYNEHDKFAAAWLRELIKADLIAPGDVDERSIEDVRPDELAGYTQCHFFAGIGVWSYALRQAGWSDDREIWTGSCPCQPFSAAGQGSGFADERHLWPAFYHLISQRRPGVIFGEQVASKNADTWLDLVHTDMEALGYAFGAVAFPAAGIGAPHIRDRTYWVADSTGTRSQGRPQPGQRVDAQRATAERDGEACGMGHTHSEPTGGHAGGAHAAQAGHGAQGGDDYGPRDAGLGVPGRLADSNQCAGGQGGADVRGWAGRGIAITGAGLGGGGVPGGVAEPDGGQRFGLADGEKRIAHRTPPGWQQGDREPEPSSELCGRPSPTNGLWRHADWLLCRDGKWRPVSPGTFPLVNGAAARVGRLRGYGNAICAEAAIAFIEATGLIN